MGLGSYRELLYVRYLKCIAAISSALSVRTYGSDFDLEPHRRVRPGTDYQAVLHVPSELTFHSLETFVAPANLVLLYALASVLQLEN